MFEVIAIGTLRKKKLWFFGASGVNVRLRATTAMSCETLGRTFQGHGRYTTQTYRVDFSEGDIITLFFHPTDAIPVGSKRSIKSLMGQGYLRNYYRLVATTG
jgi:hypothetical protein